MREEVGALADRSDDIPARVGAVARAHRLDRVPRVVERGPEEVVHRRIDDREVVRGARLQVHDARQQHAGVADQEPAGLEQQLVRARAAAASRSSARVLDGSIGSSSR